MIEMAAPTGCDRVLMPPIKPQVSLDRDLFLREMLRSLAGTMEDVVGVENTSTYFAAVGSTLGAWLERCYREDMKVDEFDVHQLAEVLVDLKARIDGGFSVHSVEVDRIVLVNSRCPFGDHVLERPSLCQMTSNVFGRIAAESNGYARVELVKTIARGDRMCHVVIDLSRSRKSTPASQEYYRARDIIAGSPSERA